MYSKEELISKKYGELLKILKKLGGKGGRQKTEKVIELILEAQNSSNQNEDHQIGEELCRTAQNDDVNANEKENLPVNMTESPNRRVTRSSTFTLDDVDQRKSGKDISVTRAPSRSPSIGGRTTKSPSPTEDTGSKDDSLTRSDTFVVVKSSDGDADSQQLSKTSDDTCVKMDLSCSEVQTAADIEHLENIGSLSPRPNSPLDDNVYSAMKKRKTTRRSLRGQLLEYNVSSLGRRMVLSELSAKLPSLISRPRTIEENIPVIEPDKKENEKPSSEISRKDLPENKNKSSAIPRIDLSDNKNKSAIPRSDIPENKNRISAIHKTDVPVPETKNKSSTIQRSDVPETKNDKSTSIPRYVAFARAAKMPNFARIHENAFKKMEALDEYVDRKHTRTKSFKGSPASAVKNNKRPSLTGSAKKAIEKIDDVPASTKTPKCPSVLSSVSSSRQSKGHKMTKTPPNKPSILPRLVKENVPPKMTPVLTWNKNQMNQDTPGSLHRRKSYVPAVPKLQFGIKKPEEGRKSYERKSRELPKQFGRRETFKQMAKKHPKLKGRDEIRGTEKQFIKGVRTNRRFELQMAKRGIHI